MSFVTSHRTPQTHGQVLAGSPRPEDRGRWLSSRCHQLVALAGSTAPSAELLTGPLCHSAFLQSSPRTATTDGRHSVVCIFHLFGHRQSRPPVIDGHNIGRALHLRRQISFIFPTTPLLPYLFNKILFLVSGAFSVPTSIGFHCAQS
ncbi:Hypothetical protein NTJ_10942 [Nesidiocoris tenuis]|uniref:Uncharacterized protein n=1 Tax=Nesidiocoris tenuis TaxID=355587 RepID=A0ABN7B121_9HEMI|nr:Hypothetical protein NTJ_10942 [Nesidiocoris tenuis]